jgi:hypothetical protein
MWITILRLYGVLLCRLYSYILITHCIIYILERNQGIPDFGLQKFLVWGSKSLTLLEYNQHLVI